MPLAAQSAEEDFRYVRGGGRRRSVKSGLVETALRSDESPLDGFVRECFLESRAVVS